MITGRTKQLFDFIRSVVGIDNIDKVPDQLVYNTMTDISADMAEKTLCIEATDTIAVNPNTELYDEPDGFFRLDHLKLPTGALLRLVETTLRDVDDMRQRRPSTTAITPQFYYRWGGQIGFYPTPQTTGTYTLYYYATTTSLLSSSVNPETPAEMDQTIVYGTLARLLPIVGKMDLALWYQRLYDKEVNDALESYRSTKSAPFQIQYYDV